MKFVQFETLSGSVVLVDPTSVVAIVEDYNCCIIYMLGGHEIQVSMKPANQVKDKLLAIPTKG